MRRPTAPASALAASKIQSNYDLARRTRVQQLSPEQVALLHLALSANDCWSEGTAGCKVVSKKPRGKLYWYCYLLKYGSKNKKQKRKKGKPEWSAWYDSQEKAENALFQFRHQHSPPDAKRAVDAEKAKIRSDLAAPDPEGDTATTDDDPLSTKRGCDEEPARSGPAKRSWRKNARRHL